MHDSLVQSLGPVMADARSAGVLSPVLSEYHVSDMPRWEWAMLGDASTPSRVAVGVCLDDAAARQVVKVTDRVQDWVIESVLWPNRPTNWPACPDHPDSHPMSVDVRDGIAAWICPSTGLSTCPVGKLP